MGGNSQKSNEQRGQAALPFARLAGMQTQGLRGEYLGQALEALRTGGSGAQIPSIQRAVEQSNMATGQALTQMQGALGTSGLRGTPQGQSLLAQVLQQGLQQTSQIPSQIAGQLASGGAEAGMGTLQAILGALAQTGKSKSTGGGGGLFTS